MQNAESLLKPLLDVHDAVRRDVVAATDRRGLDDLAGITRDETGDTIYAIDEVSEHVVNGLASRLGQDHSFVLIAEGLAGGERVFPPGLAASSATWRIIVDPIDGTRGLMYQKRSAWILTAVAPNRGPRTSLTDVALALQTEIPLLKQHLSDQMWTVKGGPVMAYRYNRLTGDRTPIQLIPSSSRSIAHGFATVSRFFPGARDELAALDEEIVLGALGPLRPGKAHCFEDQYASTGGQLYELMAGHDRFIADLRPLLEPVLAGRGQRQGLCCHPYDICSSLIATEAGVIITDARGDPLDVPLDTATDVAWVGYANASIRAQVEPVLQGALRRRGWI
jgi:fructose-1,6-bisphosphatase/inositol monophosphatase family enzyme